MGTPVSATRTRTSEYSMCAIDSEKTGKLILFTCFRIVVSAGYDGDIHIWKGIEDDDPSTGCTGEYIASVAFHEGKVFVGTDVNTVQILTYPELDRDGTKYRFTAVATAIKVNDKFVAAGSEDTNIKVYVNELDKVVDLIGHSGPILGMDITSGGQLVSASGDGTVRIWDIAEQKVLKTLEGFPKAKSFEMAECFGKKMQQFIFS